MLADVLSALGSLDARLFLLINRSQQNPVFDLVMPILSTKRYFLLPAAAAVLMLLVWGGRRMWLVLAVGVAALALADLGSTLIRESLHRTRPCYVIPDVHQLIGCSGSSSLPSNHASNMFAIATVGWLALGRWRWGLLAVAVGVAYSRVYVGVHYPGDVLAGALWGTALGWACIFPATRACPGWFTAEPPVGVARVGLNPAGGAHTR
jgi:undecaprenyl-diphosphatase